MTRTIPQRMRFRLELALLMLACGRNDEAQAVFRDIFELLDELEAAPSNMGGAA